MAREWLGNRLRLLDWLSSGLLSSGSVSCGGLLSLSSLLSCRGSRLHRRSVDEHKIMKEGTHLRLLFLLLLLGALGGLHLLLTLSLLILERSKEFGEKARALGTVLLLGFTLSLTEK